MSKFNKKQLIRDNKQSDDKAKQLKNPIGILAIFHSTKWSGGTQRLVLDRDDMLEIHNDTKDNKNDALGRIDYQIRKTNDLSGNHDLALALINYLPHTQTWKMVNESKLMDDDGFIINFDVLDTGITTRQIMVNDFETWKEVSTQTQIDHQKGNSLMDDLIKAIPTEMVLTPEQKKERERFEKERQGQKQFFYGDEYVWAINQKNADKKAKKLNLIK